MALITDPDNLNDQATDTSTSEVFINTSTLRIDLRVYGNLSTDGATEKAVYSFLKEEWKNDPHSKNLAAFPFPMVPITDEFYELVDGWDWEDSAAYYLIRQGGWTVRNTAGNVTAIFANINTGTGAEANDQLYFNQVDDVTTDGSTNFQKTGPIDQAIQVLDDPNGDGSYVDGFDYRTFVEVYLREQGQLYDKATLGDLPDTTLANPKAYGLQVATGTDPKIDATDNDIDTTSPYTGMSMTSYAVAQSKNISGNNYDFGVVIEANGGTLQEVYEWFQRQLRKSTDIDADATGTMIGKLTDGALYFVGDTLYTSAINNPQAGGTGVYINNFDSTGINDIYMTDNTGTLRNYDYTAVLTLEFNPNLVNDTDAYYWVYFTTLPGASDDWGESGAVVVQNDTPADMKGTVSGASIQQNFDYDNNVQGGRTGGTDADITVVAIGFDTGQYVRATGTIERSPTNVVSLVAPLERNYDNP